MIGLMITAGVLIVVLAAGVALTARWFRSEREADARRYGEDDTDPRG